jgi:hypothetical protein
MVIHSLLDLAMHSQYTAFLLDEDALAEFFDNFLESCCWRHDSCYCFLVFADEVSVLAAEGELLEKRLVKVSD